MHLSSLCFIAACAAPLVAVASSAPRAAGAPHVAPGDAAAATGGAARAAAGPLAAPPTYVPLTFQQPYLDSVYSPPGSPAFASYVYFTFAAAAAPPGGFQVRVSTLSPGKDVDLVVGDCSVPVPVIGAANWTSATDFVETVTVLAPACPWAPANATAFTYYIGVTPFTSGQHAFSIVVTLPAATVSLTDGVPQAGEVVLGGSSYWGFTFPVPSAAALIQLSLLSLSGDPDVYVILYSPGGAPPATPPGPGAANTYVMAGFQGANLLTMSPGDAAWPAACAVGATCTAYINVYGYTASTYIVTASTGAAIINVTDGVPSPGALAPGAVGYYAFAPALVGNITLALTVLAGAPSFYVSTSLARPTNATGGSTWASGADGDAVGVVILTSDPAYVPPPAGLYYIAVYANGAPASFTLLATSQAVATALADGQPQAGEAAAHSFVYYTFNLTAAPPAGLPSPGLDVFVTAFAGSAEVYVSNLTTPAGVPVFPVAKCLFPYNGGCGYWGADPATYTWSSVDAATPGFVSISPLALTTGQQLSIGVLATSPDGIPSGAPPPPSVYAVTASTGLATVTLQPGVPTPGAVAGGQSKFYRLVISVAGADYLVSADVATGSIDLFASEAPPNGPSARPGPGNCTYNTTQAGGILRDKILRVPWASLSTACVRGVLLRGQCNLYIAVRGYPGMGASAVATYTLSAAQTSSPAAPTLLPDGVPAYTFVPAGAYQYFAAFPAAVNGTAFYVVVNNVLGASTLFVNVGVNGRAFYTGPASGPSDYVSTDAGGYERVVVAPPGPYCANCELFITLRADGGAPAFSFVTFRSGGRLTVLSQDVPTYGSVSPALNNPVQYYSFAATDPLADVTFSLDRLFGNVNVFVSVEQPTAPWVMPGGAIQPAYTWSFTPGTFTPSLTISHNDPYFCVPGDGTRPGAPCNFIVAVEYGSVGTSAAYTITASAGASGFPVLIDGAPQPGSVLDGSLVYYSFQPAAPGYPAPPAYVTWTNIIGSVQMYVTNEFVVGQSAAAALPGPASTSCQWACVNFTGCFLSPGDPCYLPSLPGGLPVVYTVGVIGASGVPMFQNSFVVTAVANGDPVRLVPNVPTTDIFVGYQQNLNFTFDLGLEASRSDTVISATVNNGAIAMMVAHDDPVNMSTPFCSPPHSGAQLLCTGYTWLSTGVGDAMVLYIPAASPCAPTVAPYTAGPTMGGDCSPAAPNPARAYRPGRYWVTLYGFTAFSEVSLSVITRVGAVPRALLADGQPQATQSGPIVVCPFGSRDAASGACNSTAVANYTVQGSVFLLRVPSSVPAGDMYVQVDRLCGGNTTGDCGVPLWVAANGCVEGACAPTALVPYFNDSAVSRVVFDAIGGVRVPFGACYGSGAVGSAACVYAFGIYPMCAPFPARGSGAPFPLPGLGCPPALFRVTLSTPVGTQRVPQDCLAGGQTCTLPEHDVISGYSRRYEAYAGDAAHAVAVSLTATLCSGDPSSFAFYVCFVGGSCGTLSSPSVTNSDAIAIGNSAGVATLALPPLAPAVLFTAVTASGKAGLAYPTFQFALQGGAGPSLSLDPLGPTTTVYRDASLTVINVQWMAPLLSRPSTGLPPAPAAGVFYFVAAFPVGTTGQAQLSTPCGVRDAAEAARGAGPNSGVLFAENLAGTFVQLVGASASTAYSVAVVATCPGRSCMPYTLQAQSIAFPVTQSDPVPPGPSASPTPAPGGGGGGAASGAGVAGPVVGGLVGVAALVGVGVYAYRWMGARAASPYARPGGAPPPAWSSSAAAGRFAAVPTTDTLLGSGAGGYVPASVNDVGGPPDQAAAYSAL